jgi:hypothetical protein
MALGKLRVCYVSLLYLDWSGTSAAIAIYACNIATTDCVALPEDEQVLLDKCTMPQILTN